MHIVFFCPCMGFIITTGLQIMYPFLCWKRKEKAVGGVGLWRVAVNYYY